MRPSDWVCFTSSGKDQRLLAAGDADDIQTEVGLMLAKTRSTQEAVYVRKVRTLPLDVDMDGDKRCETGMDWEDEMHVEPSLIEALNAMAEGESTHVTFDPSDSEIKRWQHLVKEVGVSFIGDYYKGEYWNADQVLHPALRRTRKDMT